MTEARPEPPADRQRLLVFLVLVSALLCLVRGVTFVDEFAVDLPFSDQWDLLDPLFDHRSIVGWFLYQHGPHRQGLGGVLTFLVGSLTRFDGRAEAYLCLAGLMLSMLAAIALRRRLNGRLTWLDVVLPLLFVSMRHGHHLADVPNNAHSTTPLLLVLLLGHLLATRPGAGRDVVITLVGFLATYTGFGLFAGVLVPLAFVLEASLAARDGDTRRRNASLPFALVSAGLNATFFIGYRPESDNPNFGLASVAGYLAFAGDLFGLAARVPSLAAGRAIGWLLIVALVACVAVAARSLGRRTTDADDFGHRPRPTVVLFLGAFTLLFAVGCAIGRATLGEAGGAVPRYFALLIPGLIALSLAAERVGRTPLRLAASLALAAIVVEGHLLSPPRDVRLQYMYKDLKEAWRLGYARTGDFARACEASGFDCYPDAAANDEALNRKCAFLRAHGLSLFRAEQ